MRPNLKALGLMAAIMANEAGTTYQEWKDYGPSYEPLHRPKSKPSRTKYQNKKNKNKKRMIRTSKRKNR